MKILYFLLSLVLLFGACTPTHRTVPIVERTPGVSPGSIEILKAEDTRNPHALLQMAASLNFDRPELAARLAMASGRIPSFETWKLLAAQFGNDEKVAAALAVSARFPDTGFPASEVTGILLTLPPSRQVAVTLVGLDTRDSFLAAMGMKSHHQALAGNLWRAKTQVTEQILRDFYKRFPRESVVSIARLKARDILNPEELSRMPWQQRQMGCAICGDPERFLSDPAWQVRLAALDAAGTASSIVSLLRDPSDLVRQEALRAMLRLSPQWKPADIYSLTPREAEILAATPGIQEETVSQLFNRGGIYAEVTAPFMPKSSAARVLASPLSVRARLRFLARAMGENRAINEALEYFHSKGSAYALEYLLNRESGVDRKSLAAVARKKGGFTSVLADCGFPPSPQDIPEPVDYPRAIEDLVAFRGFRIHTAKGKMECRFFKDQAPLTCANFIDLARKGYFNGIVIHRVVPGFVTQDGDPSGSGSGGPGYTLRCEYNEIEYDQAGRIGMALAGKDTGGSQYFITHAPTPHLNHRYTIFSQVTSGLDTLSRLCQYDKVERIELF